MAQYNIMFLASNLIMLKHFLVSLYLLCISWYHKLLTNNKWTVSVVFLSPKIDITTSFWIHQYFPNLHFSGLSRSASQHALICSCLDDAEQHKGRSLITHLPPRGVMGQVLLCLIHQQSLIQGQYQTPAQERATRAGCLQLPFSMKAQGPIYAVPLCMG